MADDTSRAPLVIVTGFLGAGKTTTLNRVLGAPHGRRVAIIVNELGRIDIDAKLLRQRAGDIIELTGGCVCHEVRTQEELLEAIDEITRRAQPERIVLETTGIAEPQAILDGFSVLKYDERRVQGAVVVTIVDAEAGAAQLDRFPEARAQVECADALLLTKLDLATPESLGALHRALDTLNPTAERASFPDTTAGAAALAAWLLDRPVTRATGTATFAAHDHPHAAGQLVAVAFCNGAPMVADALLGLCARLGSRLVRAKGFVHIAGDLRRGFLERAGHQTELRFIDPWPAGPRRNELVLIGEGLDPAALERELLACCAPGTMA